MNERTARRLRKLLLGLAAAGLVLVVVPLGLAWFHFSNTPTFDEWVANHPAEDALWRAALVPGHEALHGHELMGAADPMDEAVRADHDIRALTFECVIRREDATLLHSKVLLTAALDPRTHDLRGLRLEPVATEFDRDMRSVVALTVTAPPDATWADRRAEVDVVVDFFLLAGSAESQALLLRSEKPLRSELPEVGDDGLFGLAGVFLHPFGGPPEEGIFHHARQYAGLSWRKYEGGGSGVSTGMMQYATTDKEYSWSVELEIDETVGGDYSGMTSTMTRTQEFSWMGETW